MHLCCRRPSISYVKVCVFTTVNAVIVLVDITTGHHDQEVSLDVTSYVIPINYLFVDI